jgi:FkbM family methyltransferase
MEFQSREEVEYTGRAGAEYDGDKARFLNEFWLYLEEDDDAFTPHWSDGFWEAWITKWASQQFKEHKMFWDIGANVGYYTMMAAASGLPVIAFEPQEDVADLVTRSASENNFDVPVYVCKVALSDKNGDVKMLRPGGHSGAAYIDDSAMTPAEGYEWSTLTVPTRRLDDLVNGTMPGPHLIKIDAEGAEPEIWKGMRRFVENNDVTIFMEWSADRYRDAETFADELLGNYTVTMIDFAGNEGPVSREQMLSQSDWITIVIRN